MNPLRWLTADGWTAAVGVGVAVGAGAGIPGLGMLFLFLVSGSLLSTPREQGSLRPSGRSAVQVLANGWTAALGALLVPIDPAVGWPVLAGGLAAAQADTWATEIGLRSRRPPLLLTTWQPVPPGTSGAVSGLGSVGGLLGALVMAAFAATVVALPVGVVAALGGLSGAATDSFLGATVQGRWRCEPCGTSGEERLPACGHVARHIRGWPWVDNHVVNALGTGAGAGAALAVYGLTS